MKCFGLTIWPRNSPTDGQHWHLHWKMKRKTRLGWRHHYGGFGIVRDYLPKDVVGSMLF